MWQTYVLKDNNTTINKQKHLKSPQVSVNQKEIQDSSVASRYSRCTELLVGSIHFSSENLPKTRSATSRTRPASSGLTNHLATSPWLVERERSRAIPSWKLPSGEVDFKKCRFPCGFVVQKWISKMEQLEGQRNKKQPSKFDDDLRVERLYK